MIHRAGRFFIVSVFLLCLSANAADSWWGRAHHYRVPVEVRANGHERTDGLATVAIDFTALLKSAGATAALVDNSIRVVEVSATGTVIDSGVAFQFDKDSTFRAADRARGALVLALAGNTAAQAARHFHVYFDVQGTFARPAVAEAVSYTDNLQYEGQATLKVTTKSATYLLHKTGGGFAAIKDVQANDWVGWRQGNFDTDARTWRGIPNLRWPGDIMHPGFDHCYARILSSGPLKLTVLVATTDNNDQVTWEFYPRHATMTVLKVAGPYWFLYEGTPGGVMQAGVDYNVVSTGVRRANSQPWIGDLSPEWLYFGDGAMKRVLYFAHHEDDQLVDRFWTIGDGVDGMTVWGFGRGDAELGDKRLALPNQHFTIGFCEDSAFAAVSKAVNGAYQPFVVTLGAAQAQTSAIRSVREAPASQRSGLDPAIRAVPPPARFNLPGRCINGRQAGFLPAEAVVAVTFRGQSASVPLARMSACRY